jgi:F-type H+-transporting ATPase subunit b
MRKFAQSIVIAASASPALAEAGGMPQLDPTWMPSQLFWLAISFALLYLLVARNIVPAVSRVIETRETELREALEAAQRMKEDAEESAAHAAEKAAEARKSASAMIASVQAEASRALANEQAKLERNIREKTAHAEARIADKLTKARAELEPAAAALAGDICAKLLQTPVDASGMARHLKRLQA